MTIHLLLAGKTRLASSHWLPDRREPLIAVAGVIVMAMASAFVLAAAPQAHAVDAGAVPCSALAVADGADS